MAQPLDQIYIKVTLPPNYSQLITVRDTVMPVHKWCRTPLMPTLHSNLAEIFLELYQRVWLPTQPFFLPSNPTWVSPASQPGNSSRLLWVSHSPPVTTPHFFSQAFFPVRGITPLIPSLYLLLGRSKLAEFETLINDTQIKMSSRQPTVQGWKWRYEMGTIITQMVFKAVGQMRSLYSNFHFLQCPDPNYLRENNNPNRWLRSQTYFMMEDFLERAHTC